jgi:RHS repeat-associated protein
VRRFGFNAVVALTVVTTGASASPALAVEPPFVTRPVAELFGQHPGYGFTGLGVNTATGNFTHAAVDLSFSVGLLTWGRSYNSLNREDGPLGPGWTTTLSMHLVANDDGTVALHDGDGRVLEFTPGENGTYSRPQDLDADLTRAGDGIFTLRYLSGRTVTFDATGRATALAGEGEELSLSYDGSGRLTRAAHSAGYLLTLSYDAAGHLARAEAGDGRAVVYGYSAEGTLASATEPGDVVLRYTSTDAGLLKQVVDADGRSMVTNTYGADGRVTHQDFGSGGAVDIAYDDSTGVTTATATPGGFVVAYRNDHAGRLVGATDPSGNSISQTFDGNGRLTESSARGGVRMTFSYDGHGNLTRRSYGSAVTGYSYDGQDRLISTTDPAGGLTRYEYTGDSRIPTTMTDPAGAVTRSTVVDGMVTETVDPSGAKTTFGYDAARRLVSATDPAGQTTRYAYDSAGLRTEVVSPSGATRRYSYDAAGRMSSSTDPSGAVTGYRYSASGLLLESTDPSGAVAKNTYDGAGRLIGSTDPLDRTTTYGYDGQGQLSTVTDGLGRTSRYGYDSLGRVSTVTDPGGTVVRYGYDADGRRTELVDAAGTEATSYDERGNVTSGSDASGNLTRYEYNALDQRTATVDATGATSSTTYDGAGRVVSSTDAMGAVTKYVYDAAGRLVAVIDPLGDTTRYEYDVAGRTVKHILPTGGAFVYTYDADGHKTSETTPAGLVTRFEYDKNGRLVKSIDPRGGIALFEYDALGRQTKQTSPAGGVRRLAYDAAGQLVSVVDPNGGTTRYDYDKAGNLVAMTDAKNAVTRYAYDQAGRQSEVTDPLGRTTRQSYDAAGNRTSITEPSGRTLRMEYDALGRLTGRIGADGETVTFGYDAVGRRTSMVDGTGTTRYTYDKVGRLLTTTGPDGSVVASTYDAAGRRTALTYPDGVKIDYDYNGNGWLTGLTDPRAGAVSYTLDADGRPVAEALPGRWSRTYRYDGGLLVAYTEARNGAPSFDTTLTRDADGRIVKHVDPTPGKQSSYTYDPAGQLLTATGEPGGTMRATYDAVGNRTSITRGNVETLYRYDAADQLVAADTGPKHVAYTYDESGRLLDRSSPNDRLSIGYNAFGEATSMSQSGGSVTQTNAATYNGDGLLVKVATTRQPVNNPPQTSTVSYQWTGGDGLVPQILTQRGENTADFVYGVGMVFADTATGSATLSRDIYGSAIRTSETEPWVQAQSYDVLGDPTTAGLPSLSDPAFGYRGELAYRGETGIGSLIYLRARTYDATVGRFTSRDPLAAMIGQTDSTSPYAYADNSPLNFADPTGKFSISDILAGVFSALLRGPTVNCPPVIDSIQAHNKCFQGEMLSTRGNIDQDCLDARQHCLEGLWNRPVRAEREKAAQAFALNELNKRREGFLQRLWDDQFGFGTSVSEHVDWEVKPPRCNDDYPPPVCWGPGAADGPLKIDMVTDELNIFEVKDYKDRAQVEPQLMGYLVVAAISFNVYFQRGKELQGWANSFLVREGFWDYVFGGDEVIVWGDPELPGHVYFAKEDKAPQAARVKAERKRDMEDDAHNTCIICIPVIPIISRVPVEA